MSSVRERAAELRPDLDIPWGNRGLLVPVLRVASPMLFRTMTYYEGGEAGQAEWHEHIESDGGTLMNMNHPTKIDALMPAPVSQGSPGNRPIRGMSHDTIVVAKESLRHLSQAWGLAGWIVRHGGTVPVKRVFEHPNETPEERENRKKDNLPTIEICTTVMEASGTVVVFGEGGTEVRIKLPDGTFKKVDREQDQMLPLQPGFAQMINDLSPEAREKVRIMTVVNRHRPRRFGRIQATTVVLKPAKPVDGSVEEVRQQGQELMAKGYELVKELDELR
ncbi:MAG TPA: 1-acyl-sn-glycerol-3-phosphate acyltransferase [Candidatus Saccharimonadales bacterium]|nr:1-acyl-sn-glycerol-3-phosphate acyltransferase [Candidatus Saccharimonadales bacterium]